MTEPKYACDLCGLPVEVKGFEMPTREGKKRFCCGGCLGIYQMLNDDEMQVDDDGGNRSDLR